MLISLILIISLATNSIVAEDIILDLNKKMEMENDCDYSFLFIIDMRNDTESISNFIGFKRYDTYFKFPQET